VTGRPRTRDDGTSLWRDDPTRSTRPPFTEGNTVSVRSGAWSERLVAETVEELRPAMQDIIDQAPWLQAIDAWAIDDYVKDRARLLRLERWLDTYSDRYPEGHDRVDELRDRDLREVGSLRRRCMDHRARLGLDPAARSRMALSTRVFDVALAMAALAEGDGHDGA
jgi:hypothetical protein